MEEVVNSDKVECGHSNDPRVSPTSMGPLTRFRLTSRATSPTTGR